MPKYLVTITARVTKTLEVEADTESEATEKAHSEFTVHSDGGPERYNQDIDSVEELKE
jgi:hypothetical protein